MKKTIKIISIITIMAIIISIVNISNAFSFNVSVSSNDKLVAGQEVKVTLTLSNIDMDDGIRSIKVGKITVGEEFEEITAKSFSSTTWMTTYSNGGLVLMSGTPITEEGVAVTLTLKVKQGITAKSSAVSFENIVASSGSNTGDITVDTKTITIKAEEKVEGGDQTPTTPTEPEKPTTPNITDKEQNQPNKTENPPKEILPSRIPQTGEKEVITMIVASIMVITVVFGIVSFIKYKKIR
ncbi:MAG: hypothetical protein HFJ41_06315 [Clostridia bacterium]|nr:hypothetical protein [Clostridia bacterium]